MNIEKISDKSGKFLLFFGGGEGSPEGRKKIEGENQIFPYPGEKVKKTLLGIPLMCGSSQRISKHPRALSRVFWDGIANVRFDDSGLWNSATCHLLRRMTIVFEFLSVWCCQMAASNLFENVWAWKPWKLIELLRTGIFSSKTVARPHLDAPRYPGAYSKPTIGVIAIQDWIIRTKFRENASN